MIHRTSGLGATRHGIKARASLVFSFTAYVTLSSHAVAQDPPERTRSGDGAVVQGRAVVEALEFGSLEFEQPVVDERTVEGVDVLLLTERMLPLVTVHAYFRGGYGLFDRSHYAAAMGLPAMLRYGGTTARAPTEVDESIGHHAFQVAFGTGGGSITSSINTLTEHLDSAVTLWADMLVTPRFDADEIEAWRGRQLESVRRRSDDPTRLAFSEMNLLLYGDHPVGWEMDVDDLAPDRVTPERFHEVHRRVVCRDNLVLGVTGDVSWSEARPLVDRFLDRVPDCPETLPESPTPDIRRGGGVFLIEKELEQAVIVMAHPTDVRLEDDDEYFAAMIGNSILGGGGFSSRILRRVRTEEGYAYSAASLWTTPRRHEGIIAATTRTRPENVVPAIEVILATMGDLRRAPPSSDELETTVERIVNGFVFNFDSPAQIVSRSMYYRAQDLPDDWLERYLDGIQRVTQERIQAVFEEHLRPDGMTILIVGDAHRIGRQSLRRFGPVTTLEGR